MVNYDSDLWQELVTEGRKIEKGVTHEMTPLQILKIHDWIDYIGVPQGVENPMELNRMLRYDLQVARYKLYDVTGMVMQGRWGDELTELGHKIAKSYVLCAKEIKVVTPSALYDCIDKEIYKLE
jgi:hypothetical protein